MGRYPYFSGEKGEYDKLLEIISGFRELSCLEECGEDTGVFYILETHYSIVPTFSESKKLIIRWVNREHSPDEYVMNRATTLDMFEHLPDELKEYIYFNLDLFGE